MKLKAYAKLNLALEVKAKRPDGYHELDTIMQSISLFDVVSIEKSESFSVSMDKAEVEEKSNTAYQAAELFSQYTGSGGADIKIEKRIPQMAGLGGSSADAAAVLYGLDKLYDTQLGSETLMYLGKKIGADVPFCLFGGTARAKGIGEKLERLTLKAPLWFTVVKPYQGVSTAQAFSAYTKSPHISIESAAFALQKGDIDMFRQHSGNSLGMAALKTAPDIMKAAGALSAFSKAFMSGSGSSIFCVFETQEEAQSTAENIKGSFELCGAYSCASAGVEMIGDTV